MLVLRLASANSVDGRILKRANSKLMLERLVIHKGAFVGEEEKKGAAGLSNEELMELLKDTIPLKDEPQSGVVSDKVNHELSSCLLGTAPGSAGDLREYLGEEFHYFLERPWSCRGCSSAIVDFHLICMLNHH